MYIYNEKIMANIIINKKQSHIIKDFILKEEKFEIAKKNWEKFSKEEKKAIVEICKELYPTKSKLVKEDKWYNTLGDIVGIFDPTGVVDLVNGISYISQGDNLFGLLSIVSALPYAGDIIAKPVMGALKVGAPSAKALEGILKASKAAKTQTEIAKVSNDLAVLSRQGGITGKFVEGMGFIGNKLRSVIERMPTGPLKGLKNTILQWINLFENATKIGKSARTGVSNIGKRYGSMGKIADLEKKKLESLLSKEIEFVKGSKGVFTGYRTPSKIFSWKTAFGGIPQIMGRNKSIRSLMRQTKWWGGFLDWLGLGNFVGPDEMIAQLGGEEEMMKKLEDYNKTETAKKLYQQDFPDVTQPTQPTLNIPQPQTKPEEDFLTGIIKSVFLGPLKPLSN